MSVIDLIFPKICLGCGKGGFYICPNCASKMVLSSLVCPYCEKASIDGITHVKCARKFGLDGLISIWKYEGIIRKALISLKYKYATEVGKEITHYLLLILNKMFIPPAFCLAPIPMFWYKQNIRGFNQSVELGKEVANCINCKFVPDLIIKKRSTISQVELKGNERRRNLRNVFSLNPNYNLDDLNSVILFDDVFTTGSTLMEAARVLKKAGVQKVWGLTIAR